MLTKPRRARSQTPAPQLDTINHLDCVRGLELLPTESVDLIFTDPPFNIGYDYDLYEDDKSAAEFLAWCQQWLTQCRRILKPTGNLLLCMGDEFVAELKVAATARDGSRQSWLKLYQWIVWYYTFGVACPKKLSRSHTHILHFAKTARHTVNPLAVRVPSSRQLVYQDKRANPAGRLPDNTWILRPQEPAAGFETLTDTWHVPRVCGTWKERAKITGTQMPEQLVARAVQLYSNPGELVCDPFAGSGTTLVVAKKLERHFIGFEISEQYAALANRRVELAQVGMPFDLEGVPDGSRSRPARRARRG